MYALFYSVEGPKVSHKITYLSFWVTCIIIFQLCLWNDSCVATCLLQQEKLRNISLFPDEMLGCTNTLERSVTWHHQQYLGHLVGNCTLLHLCLQFIVTFLWGPTAVRYFYSKERDVYFPTVHLWKNLKDQRVAEGPGVSLIPALVFKLSLPLKPDSLPAVKPSFQDCFPIMENKNVLREYFLTQCMLPKPDCCIRTNPWEACDSLKDCLGQYLRTGMWGLD